MKKRSHHKKDHWIEEQLQGAPSDLSFSSVSTSGTDGKSSINSSSSSSSKSTTADLFGDSIKHRHPSTSPAASSNYYQLRSTQQQHSPAQPIEAPEEATHNLRQRRRISDTTTSTSAVTNNTLHASSDVNAPSASSSAATFSSAFVTSAPASGGGRRIWSSSSPPTLPAVTSSPSHRGSRSSRLSLEPLPQPTRSSPRLKRSSSEVASECIDFSSPLPDERSYKRSHRDQSKQKAPANPFTCVAEKEEEEPGTPGHLEGLSPLDFEALHAASMSGGDQEDGDGARALQGLLRKLGAGFESMMAGAASSGSGASSGTGGSGGNSTGRYRLLLNNLQAAGEMDKQYMAAQELCEVLSMGTEDTLAGFNANEFVPALLELMKMDYNPEMMILACRGICNMVEALPGTSPVIIEHGAVPVIITKLLSIEYIDLAEQCLTTLEKLSVENPVPILRANGLSAILSFLDFFSLAVQRSAVTTASNLCRRVPRDCFQYVSDSIPTLTQLLKYTDQKILEKVVLCFARLVDNYFTNTDILLQLSAHGLMKNLTDLITPGSQISAPTFTMTVRILTMLCNGCPSLALELLETNISSVLRDTLAGGAPDQQQLQQQAKAGDVMVGASPSAMSRPTEQLYELLALTSAILPDIPKEGIFSIQIVPYVPVSASNPASSTAMSSSRANLMFARRVASPAPAGGSSTVSPPGTTSSSSSAALTPTTEDRKKADTRLPYIAAHPEQMIKLGQHLLGTLLEVSTTTVSPRVRHQCLCALVKIVNYSAPESLTETLRDIPLSSFLATLLSSRDLGLVVASLQLAHLCSNKLPAIFLGYFHREGVLHELERLATSPTVVASLEHLSSGLVPSSAPAGASSASSAAAGETDDSNSRNPSASFSDLFRRARERASLGGAGADPAGGSAAQTSSKESDEDVRSWVTQQALALRSALSAHSQEENSEGSPSHKIATLGAKLTSHGNSTQEDLYILKDICALFSKATSSDSVSSFELFNSGLIDRLLQFLTDSSKDFTVQLVDRVKLFIHVFMDGPKLQSVQNSQAGAGGLMSETSNLALLVRRLNEIFSKQEQFAISVNEPVSGRANFSGLRALTQPFRLQLKSGEADDTTLRDYSANTVMIDPLATVKAIEDFLFPKVSRKSTSTPSLSSSAAAAGSSASPSTPTKSEKTTSPSADKTAPVASKSKEETPAQTRSQRRRGRGRDDEMAGDASGSNEAMDVDQKKNTTTRKQKVPSPPIIAPRRGRSANKATATTTPSGEHEADNDAMDVDPVVSKSAAVPTADDDNGDEDGSPEGVGEPDDEFDEDDDDEDEVGEEELNRNEDEGYLFTRSSRTAQRTRNDSEVHDVVMSQEAPSAGGVQSEKSPATETLSSSASRRKSSKPSSSSPRIRLYVNGVVLPSSMLILQALDRYGNSGSGSSSEGEPNRTSLLWLKSHTITYKLERAGDSAPSSSSSSSSIITASTKASSANLLLAALQPTLPFSNTLPSSETVYNVLSLLRVLNAINQHWRYLFVETPSSMINTISPLEFVNNKLTAKILRQLQDPISICSGNLPEWCRLLVYSCPFLFAYESRVMFLQMTSFGVARAMTKFQDRLSQSSGSMDDNQTVKVGRLQRQKVRIHRNNILQYATKVLDLYGPSRTVLEIEYYDEVGTGLGPTLEFYTQVSHEFCRKDLKMWRDTNSSTTSTTNKDLVFAPAGLYPRPMTLAEQQSDTGKKTIAHFRVLGQFIGKALLDTRTVDLPLSPVLYRWLLGQDKQLSRVDIGDVDPEIARALEHLVLKVEQKLVILENTNLNEQEKEQELAKLEIEQLHFDFTLPGFPDFELKPNGRDTDLTVHNIEEFVQLVVEATLTLSVSAQIDALRAGFQAVLPLESISLFSPAELDTLLNGAEELWDVQSLTECIRADHGFTSDSNTIRYLVNVLSGFNASEQRQFLQFVTGSPRLPVGGLRNLTPQLTVVRKASEPPLTSDDYLPSAMTCANYLKLPEYSNELVMRKKLMLAMTEGQGSFHLS